MRSNTGNLGKGDPEFSRDNGNKGKKGVVMSERKRICILCGKKEEMHSYICSNCQDKIQREVMGKRAQMRKDAEKELRSYGVNPDNNKK